MASSTKENLADWLRDAHAMEGQAESFLQTQIDRLENYPEAIPRLRSHLQETKQHKAKVEQCLKRLGEDTSMVKDSAMKVTAGLQGIIHSMAGDEVLKNALASAAFEQFEAASYKMLVAAAEAVQEPEIARTCQSILDEEIAMAGWAWENLQPMTAKYLQREASGMAAKR
jgi:ferritin-like metal-binding protein YciE